MPNSRQFYRGLCSSVTTHTIDNIDVCHGVCHIRDRVNRYTIGYVTGVGVVCYIGCVRRPAGDACDGSNRTGRNHRSHPPSSDVVGRQTAGNII